MPHETAFLATIAAGLLLATVGAAVRCVLGCRGRDSNPDALADKGF